MTRRDEDPTSPYTAGVPAEASSLSDRCRITKVLRSGTPLVLAPMATLTHAGLRVLVEEFGGCDLFLSEMISAEAMIGGTRYESYYTMTAPDPTRLIFQLVGYSGERIVEAATRLLQTQAVGVDLNMGCSAPHIVRKGGGIAWMANTAGAAALVERTRNAIGDRSLSVKVRLGASGDPDHLVSFCRALESAGADFITLHPKTRKEAASRTARWSYVRLLRDELTIPVIGNGGITGERTLRTRLEQAGDGPVMVGRAAARAPWILSYLKRRMSGDRSEYRVDLASVAERFFSLLEQYQPADFLPTRAARFVSYFAGNLAFGHALGARLGASRSYDQIRDELFAYFAEHPETRVHLEHE